MIFIYWRNENEIKVEGSTFDRFRQEYRVNEATGELEEDGLIDIDEFVNSSREMALDMQIARYLPETTEDSDYRVRHSLQDDLDFFRESTEKAERYRKQFGMPDESTDSEVFEEVQKRFNAYNDVLAKHFPKKEEVSPKKEEVKGSEEV